MTAEMTAGGVPAMDDGLLPPTIEDAPEAAPEEERRRRRKLAILFLLLGLLAMLVTIAIWYLIFRQPINPLPPIPVSQVPGYSTSIYGVTNPVGIAVSLSGDRIYVAETEGDRVVRVFDAGGNQVGVAAPPSSAGSEHVPVWVAIDPITSEVYVTDRPTGQVHIYDRDGAYLRTLALAQPIEGWQPVGIAFDSQGWLYVADLGGPTTRIQVIDRQANVVRTIGDTQRLSFPNGLAIDADGRVYVADSNNGRLMVFDAEGALVGQVGRGSGEGNLGLPRGVAVDGEGRVFVVDATGQGVFVYRAPSAGSATLDYLGYFGGQGIEDGKFEFPNGAAVDARGRVYVADTVNDRIQVWSY